VLVGWALRQAAAILAIDVWISFSRATRIVRRSLTSS
jgi:hypothetical protein